MLNYINGIWKGYLMNKILYIFYNIIVWAEIILEYIIFICVLFYVSIDDRIKKIWRGLFNE